MKKIWTDDVVEFKGKYYDIPGSRIEPKPIQEPHIPIYLGGFSSNTFSRIVKYDLNGWLGVVGGPLEYLESSIKVIKEQANRVDKTPDNFRSIILTYPNVREGQSKKDENNRFPLTGSIDEIGSDIQRIKSMRVDHIIFGYNFVQTGRDVNKMIGVSKMLAAFAR